MIVLGISPTAAHSFSAPSLPLQKYPSSCSSLSCSLVNTNHSHKTAPPTGSSHRHPLSLPFLCLSGLDRLKLLSALTWLHSALSHSHIHLFQALCFTLLHLFQPCSSSGLILPLASFALGLIFPVYLCQWSPLLCSWSCPTMYTNHHPSEGLINNLNPSHLLLCIYSRPDF